MVCDTAAALHFDLNGRIFYSQHVACKRINDNLLDAIVI